MLPTRVRYLARDSLYKREKPYVADFDMIEEDGIQKSNFVIENYEIQVVPMTTEKHFHLDSNGFCILEEKTSLTLEDALGASEQIELEYQAQLERILHKHFPQYARLEPLDFVVRQRHLRFPSETSEVIRLEQPAAVAHADFTRYGAIEQLRGSFPGQEAYFLERDFDMINVWRPLLGPNNDWPLALCDFTSVLATDIVHADVLHADRRTENQMLYPNRNHRWYYIENQKPDQLLCFRNTDSSESRAVGFHAAVPNANAKGAPRTSVEVRFVAFR